MVSVSLRCGVLNGGGVCYCLPALSSGVARARLSQCNSRQCCCHAAYCLVAVSCGVVWASVSVCCSCGGVSCVRSPLVVVVGGGIVDGGVA